MASVYCGVCTDDNNNNQKKTQLLRSRHLVWITGQSTALFNLSLSLRKRKKKIVCFFHRQREILWRCLWRRWVVGDISFAFGGRKNFCPFHLFLGKSTSIHFPIIISERERGLSWEISMDMDGSKPIDSVFKSFNATLPFL